MVKDTRPHGKFRCNERRLPTRINSPNPARSCVAVAGLPLGAMVEIELIA